MGIEPISPVYSTLSVAQLVLVRAAGLQPALSALKARGTIAFIRRAVISISLIP